MFVFLFFVFALFLVFTENLLLFGIFSIVSLFLLLLFNYFYYKLGYIRLIGYFVLAVVFSLISVFAKNYYYFEFNKEIDGERYIGTGIILDKLETNRYVFYDDKGRYLIYNSKDDLNVGDKIKTFSYVASDNIDCNVCNFDTSDLFSYTYDFEFDYDKWLFMENYHASLNEENNIKLSSGNDVGMFYGTKNDIKNTVTSIFGENNYAGLVLGVLLGDRSYMSEKAYDNFLSTGLVHIISTSGTHVTFLILFLHFALFFIPFYPRLALIVLSITFYTFLVGLSPNILRAWIMGTITVLALFWGRKTNIMNLIKIAFFLIILFNPYVLLYDLGFSLSFSALIGIIIFDRLINIDTSSYMKNLFQKYILPTFGASMGVMPFLIFFVNEVNLLSFVANILVVPLLPILMIGSFFVIGFYYFWQFGFLKDYLTILIDYFYEVADMFDNIGVYMVVDSLYYRLCILLLFVLIGIVLLFISLKSAQEKN